MLQASTRAIPFAPATDRFIRNILVRQPIEKCPPSWHFSTSPSSQPNGSWLANSRLASRFCDRLPAITQPVDFFNRLLNRDLHPPSTDKLERLYRLQRYIS